MSADEKDPKTEDVDALWAEAMAEQAQTGATPGAEDNPPAEPPEDAGGQAESNAAEQEAGATQKAPFEDLQATAADATPPREFDEKSIDSELDVILDIPVTVSMEIGRTRLPIRNLLRLNQGSVVELDRLAGEPLDVLVNGTLIAHGEVVLINDKYGIRLTDVISPQERVRKLK